MPFITDPTLMNRVRTALGKLASGSGAFIESTWTEIVQDSNIFAQNEITASLVARGYTAAQAQAWDRAAEYNTDLGLWRALIVGGVAGEYDKEFIDELDRREELQDEVILIGGLDPLDPDPDDDGGGPVRSGPLENPTDRWTTDSPW